MRKDDDHLAPFVSVPEPPRRRGRRPLSDEPSRRMTIRLPPDAVSTIMVVAGAADLSVSAWVRATLLRALPAGNVRSSLPPSPPQRRHVPADDLAAVSKLAADLSRIGGALVQTTKALRETAHPSHIDAETVLGEVRQVQRQLSNLIATMSVGVVPIL